eukprot:Nk52_evm11s310 gene=Nk52_evmTU11s310
MKSTFKNHKKTPQKDAFGGRSVRNSIRITERKRAQVEAQRGAGETGSLQRSRSYNRKRKLIPEAEYESEEDGVGEEKHLSQQVVSHNLKGRGTESTGWGRKENSGEGSMYSHDSLLHVDNGHMDRGGVKKRKIGREGGIKGHCEHTAPSSLNDHHDDGVNRSATEWHSSTTSSSGGNGGATSCSEPHSPSSEAFARGSNYDRFQSDQQLQQLQQPHLVGEVMEPPTRSLGSLNIQEQQLQQAALLRSASRSASGGGSHVGSMSGFYEQQLQERAQREYEKYLQRLRMEEEEAVLMQQGPPPGTNHHAESVSRATQPRPSQIPANVQNLRNANQEPGTTGEACVNYSHVNALLRDLHRNRGRL